MSDLRPAKAATNGNSTPQHGWDGSAFKSGPWPESPGPARSQKFDAGAGARTMLF